MACRKYGKAHYQIEFQTPGYGRGRFRCSTGTTTKSVAEAYEKHLLTLYHEGRFELLDRVRARALSLPKLKEQMDQGGVKGLIAYVEEEDRKAKESADDLAALVEEFLSDPDRAANDTTYANYRTQLGWLLRSLDAQVNGPSPKPGAPQRGPAAARVTVTPKHLTSQRISTWLREVESTPSERYAEKRTRRPKTVNHHRAAASAFCSWLVARKTLTANPCEQAYRARVVQGDPVYLNRAQWAVFRAASLRFDEERIARWKLDPKQDPDRPYPCTLFWDFLVASGATSYNEGCAVRMADVYLDENPGSTTVRVYLQGTKTNNRPRSVYISRALAERLRIFAEEHKRPHFQSIFPWGKHEAFHVWSGIKRAMLQAGHGWMEPVRVYDLRHTYAVNMIQGDPERNIPGVDIVTLARLMGHGDNIETTMIYARHVGDYARRACMVLHDVLGL